MAAGKGNSEVPRGTAGGKLRSPSVTVSMDQSEIEAVRPDLLQMTSVISETITSSMFG